MYLHLCLWTTLCVLIADVNCSVIHAPLHSHEQHIARTIIHGKNNADSLFEKGRPHGVDNRNIQQPLSTGPTKSGGHRTGFWDSGLPGMFSLGAAIGTPPQPFRLLIDLTGKDLFVPNTACDSPLCKDFRVANQLLFYDANTSSTYEPTGQIRWSEAAGVIFEGPLANDTFHLAGLSIPEQRFINADDISPLGWAHFYYGWEGILGLAPRWNTSYDDPKLYDMPSPWMTMVDRSVLSKNIIAIDIPHGPEKLWDVSQTRIGEISFGGISSKYADSNFTHLPLTNYTDLAWATQMTSFAWNNGTYPLRQTFTNLTLAGFDSTAWYMGLPGDWVETIFSSIPNLQCAIAGCEIPCTQRAAMPNMTFGFGEPGGKETLLTVSPHEYIVELEGEDKETHCWFSFMESRHMGYPVDTVVLGMPFLNAFYTVLDLDEREIRLAKPILPHKD